MRSDDHTMTPDAAGDGRNALRVGLVAVVTLVAFESLAVTTILPEIEADLGGLAWYGWVTTAFFLGTMIGIVFAGDQADRRGAGPPYVAGLVLFAIGLLIGGFAPSMPVLVVGRFVQGFGAGVVPAIGYIAIGRAFTVTERPRMFAILSTAWVVPGLVGPVLAERIAHGVGWRYVFLGLVPFVVVAGTLVVPAVMRLGAVDHGDTAPVPWTRLRLVEAVRVAGGAALVVAAFTAQRWLAPLLVVAGLVVGIGPFRRLTPPGTLRGRAGLPAVIASRGVLTFVFFGTDAFIPFALTNGRAHSALAGSVAVTVGTVSWTAATWIQDRFIARLGEARFVRAGYAVLVTGVVVVAAGSVPDGLPFWTIHLGAIAAGFGMGLAYSAHAQLALRSVEERHVGSTTASLQLTDNLGIALGSGTVGAIVTLGDDIGWSAGSSVAIALAVPMAFGGLGLALSRRLPRTRPIDVGEPSGEPAALS